MRYSTQIKPISYLKNNIADVVRELNETREPMIITQNGEAKVVVQDIKSYEEMQETLALLRLLALAEKQIEEGKTKPAKEVFAKYMGAAAQ